MAQINVQGSARIDFEVSVDVDVEDLVQDALRDELPVGFEARDVEIDSADYNG